MPDTSGEAVRAEPAPSSGKRSIVRDALTSLRKDPLSLQFLWPWFWSMLPGHDPIRDALPWMTFRAIRWLRAYLRPRMAVFEFGAGGSTLFFARRAGTVTSIENDPRWHGGVANALEGEGISNCDLLLVPAERTPSVAGIAYGPASYTSTDPEFAGHSFEAYARSIDAVPDGSLDLVSVDGHARFSCVARAIPKVRPGGYLLLDNSDWEIYDGILHLLRGYPRTDFPGVGPFQPNSWRTSVWRIGVSPADGL